MTGEMAPLRPLLSGRYLAAAGLLSALFALVLAIPTAIIPNQLFTRMTPVEPEQYVIWLMTSVLAGALAATYLDPVLRGRGAGQSAGAGLLGIFAIGCPVCNKLVVSAIGTSGALTYFAPLQPVIGAGAVALGAVGLWLRFRAVRSQACRTPAADGRAAALR